MAIDRCKACNANLALVGVRHRCSGQLPPPPAYSDLHLAPKPAKKSRARSSTVEHSKVHPAPSTVAGSNPAASITTKRGRPRIGEKRDAAKPWEALGLSERTYYRRKKELVK